VLSAAEFSRAEARIFALLSEWFTLGSKGWMSRQLLSVMRTLLRYLYAGSASARFSAAFARAFAPEQIASWVRRLRDDVMWPGGSLKPPGVLASWEAHWRMRDDSLVALLSLPPPAAASLLGRLSLDNGLIKLHAMLQVPVVCRSLIFTLFDCALSRLFPGITVGGIRHPNMAVLALSLASGGLGAAAAPGGRADAEEDDAAAGAARRGGAADGSTPGSAAAATALAALPALLYSRFLLGGVMTDAKMAALQALCAQKPAAAAQAAHGAGAGTAPSDAPAAASASAAAVGFSPLVGCHYGLPLPAMEGAGGAGAAPTDGSAGPAASATTGAAVSQALLTGGRAVVNSVRYVLPSSSTVSRAFSSSLGYVSALVTGAGRAGTAGSTARAAAANDAADAAVGPASGSSGERRPLDAAPSGWTHVGR
jgi:hypothetical protein